MTARATPTVDAVSEPVSDTARLYQEGMIAGVIGAITVAVWFLLLDTAAGHPFYTPTVLGTAIFRRSALASPETLSVSLEMVGMFTWVHMLVFAAPVLRLIPWPSVLVANLLAAAAMSAYFWWRHPGLVVRP